MTITSQVPGTSQANQHDKVCLSYGGSQMDSLAGPVKDTLLSNDMARRGWGLKGLDEI